MLGKFLNFFTHNANTSFVIISVVASGLTVSFIFVLANRMYDRRTAFWSSILAITSPLFWFYGEVALTYILEAFLSVFLAYLCWRILNGEHKLIFLSALFFAFAGGIRQSTMVFLLPLWFYSIRKTPYTYMLLSFVFLAVAILSWFLPMLSMTGGYGQYRAAVDAHWSLTFEPFTVIKMGLKSIIPYAQKFIHFTIYGLSLCVVFVAFYIFKVGLEEIKKAFLSKRSIFITFWIIPYMLALFLLLIKTANPGYFLLFMPALLIVSVRSLVSIRERGYPSAKMFVPVMLLTVILNLYVFFCTNSYMSVNMLKRNDADIADFVKVVSENFSPSDTIILSYDYAFNGPRHYMYYLPGYRVYIIDERVDLRGRKAKVFWGYNHNTLISEALYVPKGTHFFVSRFDDTSVLNDMITAGESVNILYRDMKKIAFYGDISLAQKAYSKVKFEIEK